MLYVRSVSDDQETCVVVDTSDSTAEEISCDIARQLVAQGVEISGVADSGFIYPVSYFNGVIVPYFEWQSVNVYDGLAFPVRSFRKETKLSTHDNRRYALLLVDEEDICKIKRYDAVLEITDERAERWDVYHPDLEKTQGYRGYSTHQYGRIPSVLNIYTVDRLDLRGTLGGALSFHDSRTVFYSAGAEEYVLDYAKKCYDYFSQHPDFTVTTMTLEKYLREVFTVPAVEEEGFHKELYWLEDVGLIVGATPMHTLDGLYSGENLYDRKAPYFGSKLYTGDWLDHPSPVLRALDKCTQHLYGYRRRVRGVTLFTHLRDIRENVPMVFAPSKSDFAFKCFEPWGGAVKNYTVKTIIEQPDKFDGVSIDGDTLNISTLQGKLKMSISSYQNLYGLVDNDATRRLKTRQLALGHAAVEVYENGKIMSVEENARGEIIFPTVGSEVVKNAFKLNNTTTKVVIPANIKKFHAYALVSHYIKVSKPIIVDLRSEEYNVCKNVVSAFIQSPDYSHKVRIRCANTQILINVLVELIYHGGSRGMWMPVKYEPYDAFTTSIMYVPSSHVNYDWETEVINNPDARTLGINNPMVISKWGITCHFNVTRRESIGGVHYDADAPAFEALAYRNHIRHHLGDYYALMPPKLTHRMVENFSTLITDDIVREVVEQFINRRMNKLKFFEKFPRSVKPKSFCRSWDYEEGITALVSGNWGFTDYYEYYMAFCNLCEFFGGVLPYISKALTMELDNKLSNISDDFLRRYNTITDHMERVAGYHWSTEDYSKAINGLADLYEAGVREMKPPHFWSEN